MKSHQRLFRLSLVLLAGSTSLVAQIEVTGAGLVGVGTASPSAKLEVIADITIRAGADGQPLKLIGRSADNFSQLAFYNNAKSSLLGLFQCYGDGTLVFVNSPGSLVERMRISSAGNVGIGTTTPSYKLTVSGSVRATSFIADVNTYADFVFRPGYRLAPLAEIEAHIAERGHLPGIPSEAEARERGVDVVDMQIRLLQKIEEITLHQIAQQKELAALKAENAALREALSRN